MKPTICLFLLSLAPVALSCSSCTRSNGEARPEVNKPFALSALMKRELEVKPAQLQPVRDELSLTGMITSNEDRTVKVFPLAGGVVEQLSVELGDHVTKGQVLAVVRSGEAAGYESDAVATEATVNAARKNYEATQDLFKAGLASERDLVSAREDLKKAQAEAQRSRKQMSVYNVDKDGRYTVTAPLDGIIIDKNVTTGMQFRADNVGNLFTIANLSDVWIIANVFESDISKVAPGYTAHVRTLSYPDRVFEGKIDRVFNVLDPDSKVMKVRIRLDNPGYLLKPQMYAQITVTNTEAGAPMLAIPAKALVFDKNRNFVMVYRTDSDISTREVRVEKTVGDVAYIRSGLQPGEEVLTRNQLLIYDQLND
jgi:membrane fusion protein, heavy metal efflux system